MRYLINPIRATGRAGAAAWLLALAALLPQSVPAETKYVTDKLMLGLYEDERGRGQQFKVIPSGTAVEILEEKGRYARIRTPDDVEGWVKSHFLVRDAPAIVRIKDVQQRLERIEAANPDTAALEARNADLQRQLSTAESSLADASAQVLTLRQELELASQSAASARDEAAAARQAADAARAEASATVAAAREAAAAVAEVPAGESPMAAAAAEPEPGGPMTAALDGAPRRIAALLGNSVLLGIGGLLVLGLGFLLGYKSLEYYIRRQHGGYRIW